MKLQSLVLITVIFVISSCATQKKQSIQERFNIKEFVESEKLVSKDSVRITKLVNWTPIDTRSLIISSSFKKQFLIDTSSGCFNLRNATQIALKQRQEYRLSQSFDSILVSTFHSKEECRILKIYPITTEQKQRLVQKH